MSAAMIFQVAVDRVSASASQRTCARRGTRVGASGVVCRFSLFGAAIAPHVEREHLDERADRASMR